MDASIIRVWLEGQDEPLVLDGAVWTYELIPGWLRLIRGGETEDAPVRGVMHSAARVVRVETDWAMAWPTPAYCRTMTAAEYLAAHGPGAAP